MQTKPLISVVTVCRNAADTIEATMLSVLNQTYPRVEYIVIDGGSTDGTADIINKYADRLAYWVSEPDRGIYDAMNKGIAVASGDYVNFMNAGDRFCGDDVLHRIFACRTVTEDFVAGAAMLGNGRGVWLPVADDFTFADVCNGGGVNHQSSFIRRPLLAGGYDTSAAIIADDLFFIDRVVFGGCSYRSLPVIVCIYDTTGISSTPSSESQKREERMRFLASRLPQRIVRDYTSTKTAAVMNFASRLRRKIEGLVCLASNRI